MGALLSSTTPRGAAVSFAMMLVLGACSGGADDSAASSPTSAVVSASVPPSAVGFDPPTFARRGGAASGSSPIDAEQATLLGYGWRVVHVGQLIDEFSDVFGPPTADSGWQPMPSTFWCQEYHRFRTLWWGDVRVSLEGGDDTNAWLTGWGVGVIVGEFSPVIGGPGAPTGVPLLIDGLVQIGSPATDIDQITSVRTSLDHPPLAAPPSPIQFAIVEDRVAGFAAGRPGCYSNYNIGL